MHILAVETSLEPSDEGMRMTYRGGLVRKGAVGRRQVVAMVKKRNGESNVTVGIRPLAFLVEIR